MSVGPMGMAGGAAGSPLAQGKGSEVNRGQRETAEQSRQTEAAEKAEKAAGIGQTEQDEEASDRDADGRRLWEGVPEGGDHEEEQGEDKHVARDPTGQVGSQVDLNG
ncbi:MAG: hypothetical protein ACODAD_15185 [Planctomycetota bacterium]